MKISRASEPSDALQHRDPREVPKQKAPSDEEVEAAIAACRDEDEALAHVYVKEHPTRAAFLMAISVMERMR